MAYVVDRMIDHFLYPAVSEEKSLVYPTYNVGGTECLVVTRNDATNWLVYCHGNAVTLQDLYQSGVAAAMSAKCNCNFVAPAYPRYNCTGSKHDAAIITAVQAAYERLCDDHNDQVYMAGRSLGVAIALASCRDRPPRGLLLLSGFSSLYNMVPRLVPRCLIGRRYENDKVIACNAFENVHKLIVHGTRDTVIPVQNANTLAAAASNVRLCIISGMDHNPDAQWSRVFALFKEFLSKERSLTSTQVQYPLW